MKSKSRPSLLRTQSIILANLESRLNGISGDEVKRISDIYAIEKNAKTESLGMLSKDLYGRLPYEQLIWEKENQDQQMIAPINSNSKRRGSLIKRDGSQHDKTIGFYKVGKEIGSGNFAKVRLGLHKLTKEKVALKIIEKSRVDVKLEKMLSREISGMECLSHPNLIRLFEVIETPERIYLITEYAPGGDLRAKIKSYGKLPPSSARHIFRQITSSISFIHAKGIVHRDLKADNVLFTSGLNIKVGDFGFSTKAKKGELLMTFCGSPPYAAPELFRDVSYEGPQVDIWALGILLYYMIRGNFPFISNNIAALKKAILAGKYEVPEDFDESLVDLLKSILNQKPSRRATCQDIIHHPWLCRNLDEGNSSYVKNITLSLQNRILLKKQLQLGIPTEEQILAGSVTLEESQALRILKDIGVSEETIESSRALGIKSHVTGIYRIILHRLQRGEDWEPSDFVDRENEQSKLKSGSNSNLNSSESGKIWGKLKFNGTNSANSETISSTACSIL